MKVDQAESLRRLVKERIHKISPAPQQVQFPCRVITVTSGKGGVGKTNFAANLAISLAKIHKRVLLMDADLGLPDINVVMGLIPPPRYNLYHVITGRKKISEILTEGPYGVRLITGAVGINEIANLSAEKRNEIIAELAGLGNFTDMIIIDTGAGLTSNILGFVLTADEVILITTPEPPAIADAYGMIKAIASESKDVNIRLVVNRVRSLLEGKAVADRIVNIVAQFLSMRVEKLGYIVEDKAVGKAIRRQKPLLSLYPTSKSANCILHIRNKLIQAPPKMPKRGFKGFLARLLGIETEYY